MMRPKNNNKRRRNKKRKQVYSLSSNPQRYGPGSNVSVINLGKSVSSSSFGRFSLQSLLEENDEFSLKKTNFKFFKIEEIRAVFLPANVSGSFPLGALNMSWNLTSIATSELLKDDSTKYFPIYRTKNIVFRYLPPRTVLDVQSIAETPPNKFFDFSKYLNCDTTVNFPGWLYVWNPSNVLLHFDFQAIVRFRGNDFHSAPSKTIFEEDMYCDKMFLCDPQGNTLSTFVIKKENKKILEESKEMDGKSENKIEVEKDIKFQNMLDKQKDQEPHLLGNSQHELPIEDQKQCSIMKAKNKEKIKKSKSKEKKTFKFQPQISIQSIPELIKNKENFQPEEEEEDSDNHSEITLKSVSFISK